MPYYSPEHLKSLSVNFIIGSGRSGTTLMTTVFNANPTVLAAPEVRLCMAFYQKYAHQNPVSATFAHDLASYINLVIGRKKATRKAHIWGSDIENSIFNNLDPAKIQQLNYANLYKLLQLNIEMPNKNNADAQIIIDKNPDYTFYVEPLMRLFPDAKFVVMLRDYRSVVSSYKLHQGKRIESCVLNAFLWNKFNRETARLHTTYPNKVMLLRYEDLVQDTEKWVRQTCQFLNIGFDKAMLTPHQNLETQAQAIQNTEVTARDKKKIGELTKPINTSHLGAWKTRLTDQEIIEIETLCAQTGSLFGYEPSKQLTATDKLKVYLLNLPRLVLANITFWLLVKNYFYLPFSLRMLLIKYLKITR